ncbi:hypothetical protein [Rhizobium rhizogenes]|uniref:Uncharacterized protein n=1 Tax=Rhizobium rhizogenes (strain K84 / ATCC BAA-868) TaxID=311403 RepID=B9JQN3_RHIR8|nr:hypothetical protein Arad_12501 [Rhizobium rhizogenes K84]NTG77849.1 hypothetical protein [Rhizobium rhizogenes]
MTSIAFTEVGVRSAKRALKNYFPAIQSSHLTEALAAACGFKTHAALGAALKASNVKDPSFLLLDRQSFGKRLAEVSGHIASDSDIPFDLPCFVEEADGISTTSRRYFEIDYSRSARKLAWRNVMVAAINAGIDQRLFSIRPGDNRWPGGENGGPRETFSFKFSIGNIPAVASVHDGGFDELSIHAAFWPTEDGLRVVRSLNGNFRAGEVFATGWLERRDGAWLQVSSSSPEFACRKHRLEEVASLEVSPRGYADRGSFKV